MSLSAAYTELANVITGDAGIVAWAASAGGTLTVLKGNRVVERIDPSELPALVMEMGSGRVEPAVSGHVSENRHEMRLSFVWEDEGEALAFSQRLALVPLVQKAVMGNATLDGSVDGAWVSEWEPDYGYNHPRQSVGFIVSADLMISR